MLRLAFLSGVFTALAGSATAEEIHDPWAVIGASVQACAERHPSTACMTVSCGPAGNRTDFVLSFTDLGYVRDTQKSPAGKKDTAITLVFPDETQHFLYATRVPVQGTAYNRVEAKDWTNDKILESILALGNGNDEDRIVAILPDGRSSAFSTRDIGFAFEQLPKLCRG